MIRTALILAQVVVLLIQPRVCSCARSHAPAASAVCTHEAPMPSDHAGCACHGHEADETADPGTSSELSGSEMLAPSETHHAPDCRSLRPRVPAVLSATSFTVPDDDTTGDVAPVVPPAGRDAASTHAGPPDPPRTRPLFLALRDLRL